MIRGRTVAKYEFEAVETFRTAHFYTVEASTRAEALDKVLYGDHEAEGIYVIRGDLFPVRPMTVRDVKRGRRVPETDDSGPTTPTT